MINSNIVKKANSFVRFGFLLSIMMFLCNCTADAERGKENSQDIVADTLMFTTNESFFSPVGTLRAHLVDKTSGEEYNKFEYYDYIYDWNQPTDTILFAVTIKKEVICL